MSSPKSCFPHSFECFSYFRNTCLFGDHGQKRYLSNADDVSCFCLLVGSQSLVLRDLRSTYPHLIVLYRSSPGSLRRKRKGGGSYIVSSATQDYLHSWKSHSSSHGLQWRETRALVQKLEKMRIATTPSRVG